MGATAGYQRGPARERALRCRGALERGDGTAPEPLAQLGDALGAAGAVTIVADAAELVVTQAALARVRVGGGASGARDKRAGATVRRRTRAR